MSGFVSRWVVAREHRVEPDDLDAAGDVRGEALEGWISGACDAYLERCAVLRDIGTQAGLTVRSRITTLPDAAGLGRPATVVVSAGATEVRPRSFTIALEHAASHFN
jgi:hypothetical protein